MTDETEQKKPAAAPPAESRGAASGAAAGPHDAAAERRDPSAAQPEEKIVEVYPAPDPELPEPTLKQYFLGWGVVFLGLVLVAVLLGVLMRVLR